MACLTDCMLISWWGMENVVTDCFGCNNGTWSGCCAYTSTGTPMCNDTAAVFSCANIGVANECMFDFIQSDDFSVTAWVKTCRSTEQSIVTKTSSIAGGVGGWYLANKIGGCRIQFAMTCMCFNIGRVFATLTGLMCDGWHHVAVTKPANNNICCVNLYFDGTLASACKLGPLPGGSIK